MHIRSNMHHATRYRLHVGTTEKNNVEKSRIVIVVSTVLNKTSEGSYKIKLYFL